MPDIYLFNSLTRKKEKFVPLDSARGKPVGLYTCGPTVYDHASIGNFRTYFLADILLRVLRSNGFEVKYFMNLTDVGHLTGDNFGDADLGEDRMAKAAMRERKTAWDVADYYIKAFYKDFDKLNFIKPERFVRATDHIGEQIDLIEKLEKKGLTYKISDGVYFDTRKFEGGGKKYGELSTLDRIKEGARVRINTEKRNPRDFALWKFSPRRGERDMEWNSPFGVGFPGWHLECSAMSMKYLGESFDVHVGGEDLRSTHHPNEIAQSEGATGKKFVKYWIHGAFLKVDGGRMGKSLGNVYTISDLEEKGFSALDLRYFYLTGKYNEPLNFTWESLQAAQTALVNIKNQIANSKNSKRTDLSGEKSDKIDEYRAKFERALADDLNAPRALAVLWEMVKSNIPAQDKYDLAVSFDEVLGLNFGKTPALPSGRQKLPHNIKDLISKREKLRKEGKFAEADELRRKIYDLGCKIRDEKIS